jgi:hypothetical protein
MEDRLKEPIRFWRICLEHVHWILEDHGKNIYHWQNSHTITVTKVASKYHHLKHSMEESADRPSAGMKQELAKNFIRTMLRKGNMPLTLSVIN